MLRLDFIFPPGVRADNLRNRVLQITERYGNTEVIEEYDGFTAERPIHLERALKKAGVEVRYTEMYSWTDALHLKKAGCNAVVWGPGELSYCHTAMERIAIDEILKASNVIVNLNGLF
jgi:acetylornithine deacetylase/succinyl-diaminopimelate desuccinylase-like protein